MIQRPACFRARAGALATGFLLALALAWQVRAAAPTPDGIAAMAERARAAFEVPGLAVAVVKDGEVVLARGFGVRRAGGRDPVDADTLFGIASNSKAFTTAALAILADEGRLDWNDRVIDHLPQFRMYDPYVTREFTVRDLVTHRSGLGLGAGDLMFWPETTFTREEIIRGLRHLKPVSSFRAKYDYDNLLYMVAGELVPAATGQSWEEFVRQRIFLPLGMRRTNTSVHDFGSDPNVVSPHVRMDGRVHAVEWSGLDNVAAAGAINSSAADMSRWALAQLAGGEYRDAQGRPQRLFSEKQHREMWSPQMPMPAPAPIPELPALQSHFSSYALGWRVNDYRGHRIVGHTGAVLGNYSRVTLVPELGLGIVVLTNSQESAAHSALTWQIVDAWLEAPAFDWVAGYQAYAERTRREAAQQVGAQAAARNARSKPSLPLAAYAGKYRDPWFGEIELKQEGKGLVLHFPKSPRLVGDVEHWQYDTFAVRWRERTMEGDAYMTFDLKPEGGIRQMTMKAISPLTDFSFDFHDLLFTPVAASGAPAD